jgi:lysophospholipase L1-like esterase
MENRTNSRRNFIKKAVVSSLMAVSIPEIISAAMIEKGQRKIQLAKDDVILFQGDSITDAGRNREDTGFNTLSVLGSGYAMLAAASLLEKHASLNLKISNRGISGNKVYQLAERWDKDCLEIKPGILSILIGVNDFWHMLNGNYKGTIEIYRNDFFNLIQRTKTALPDIRLIIGEPFAVPGIKAVDDKWYPDFYEYQKTAREIAALFGAILIPYQNIYDKAQKHAPGVYWTGDGVHPTLAGAQLMAEAWLDAVK